MIIKCVVETLLHISYRQHMYIYIVDLSLALSGYDIEINSTYTRDNED